MNIFQAEPGRRPRPALGVDGGHLIELSRISRCAEVVSRIVLVYSTLCHLLSIESYLHQLSVIHSDIFLQ